ncbi:MAG: class I SAM-dependent methyltransferase [Candidatus Thiodiazotropha weberae]|nr:class I SAM-dependent methyltransferase [Candidatus Thiodiazotropha lotti]MCG8011898.1 class I SAM-dependent methyltransferase [Candidatus Thiodiazotropha lotti]MCW4211365.1 class I SAM-dependent methyltransferase [Candidatus Thiodiazotropha lotti]MCW4216776.1 class I SAM-dependent methyltransferase [Candidatus Thiodiazotropha lotti]
MKNNNENKLFFYADEDASQYDELVALTDPAYKLIHDSLNEQLCSYFSFFQPYINNSKIVILDVGCGTGAEAIPILLKNKNVHIFCLDTSRNMLDALKANASAHKIDSQYTILNLDIRNPEWFDIAKQYCLEVTGKHEFDGIISVYALHHFTRELKYNLYKAFFDITSDNGFFVNGDLYSFQTGWLSSLAQQSLENWISKKFDLAKDDDTFSTRDSTEWERLKLHWLSHVRNDNIPLPAQNNKLTPASSHHKSDQEILLSSGFESTECTFRYGQSAIMWAFKGSEK